MWVCRER